MSSARVATEALSEPPTAQPTEIHTTSDVGCLSTLLASPESPDALGVAAIDVSVMHDEGADGAGAAACLAVSPKRATTDPETRLTSPQPQITTG